MTHALVVCVGALAIAPAVSAQLPLTFYRTDGVRWLNGRQQAAFTVMESHQRSITLTRMADTTDGHRIYDLTFTQHIGQPGPAHVITDGRGRVLEIQAQFHELRKLPGPQLVGPKQQLAWEVFDNISEGEPFLPQTLFWDVIPTVPSGRLRKGARWIDTLNLAATLEGYRQTLTGIRTSVVVGDTVVAGTRLVIIRDAATVTYAEQFPSGERSIDTTVTVERSAQGTIAGRYLYDPALKLFRVRTDTTHLTGDARLEYGDGRTFHTPATFDRHSRVELMDSAARAALAHRRDSIAAGFSIVMRPEGDAERIANGDTTIVAALLDTLARSRNPEARTRASRAIALWARDSATRRRVRAARLAAGDTVSVLKEIIEAWWQGRVDSSDAALELPMVIDPGVAFAFGLDRDGLYDGPAAGFLEDPPAIDRDTAGWHCSPAACRLIAAQWAQPVDQRLRNDGLIARMAMEPRVWSDTVLARWQGGDHFFDGAASFIRGVAADWPAGSHAPLPVPDADWHAWSNWMDGKRLTRFDERHRTVLQFAQARTGRDFAGEWRRQMGQASGDTARLVFGTLLSGMRATEDTTAIIANLQSTSPLRQQLGQDEVIALFSGPSPLASLAIQTAIQDTVLAIAIDGAPPWVGSEQVMPQHVVENVDRAYAAPPPQPGPLMLVGDSLTPSVRDRWGKRGVRFVSSNVHVPSGESVVQLHVSAVHAVGPFLRVTVAQSHLTARLHGRGESWAGGATVYLMRSGAGWVFVGGSHWIT
ncbi:MAG TPA: hypothetical protein VFA43_05070 [Gemmatimonadaceae bacterium]|nr:hypothetical protein [Gemmatimonadaceae bacterium]